MRNLNYFSWNGGNAFDKYFQTTISNINKHFLCIAVNLHKTSFVSKRLLYIGLGVSDSFSLPRRVTSADRSHGTNCDVWIIWTNAKSLQSSQRDQRRESEVFALPQGSVASVLHVCSNNIHVSPINCACIRVNIWLWSAKALIGVFHCKEIYVSIFTFQMWVS